MLSFPLHRVGVSVTCLIALLFTIHFFSDGSRLTAAVSGLHSRGSSQLQDSQYTENPSLGNSAGSFDSSGQATGGNVRRSSSNNSIKRRSRMEIAGGGRGSSSDEDQSRETSGAVRQNLVLYIFSKSDPTYEENFLFFVEHAVMGDTGSDFVILMQQEDSQVSSHAVCPPRASTSIKP